MPIPRKLRNRGSGWIGDIHERTAGIAHAIYDWLKEVGNTGWLFDMACNKEEDVFLYLSHHLRGAFEAQIKIDEDPISGICMVNIFQCQSPRSAIFYCQPDDLLISRITAWLGTAPRKIDRAEEADLNNLSRIIAARIRADRRRAWEIKKKDVVEKVYYHHGKEIDKIYLNFRCRVILETWQAEIKIYDPVLDHFGNPAGLAKTYSVQIRREPYDSRNEHITFESPDFEETASWTLGWLDDMLK